MKYIGMPVEGATNKQLKTLNSLKNAIDTISTNEDLAIADFILRSQIFEFNLKYLWQRYGFKKIESTIEKPYERWTLGDTITVLKKHDDEYFSRLISMCEEINKARNTIIHHILDEETDYNEIKREAIAHRSTIDKAQQEIWHYLEWDKTFIY